MDRPTDGTLRVAFFSFGILEQAGGFENYLMSTTRGLAEHYKELDITIVTMSPEIVERLQHLYTIYFMRKQEPKAIYRETYDSVIKKLDGVKYIRATSLSNLKDILQNQDVIYSKNEALEMVVLNRIGLKKLPPVIIGVHTPIFYPNTPSLSARLHNLVYTGPVYRKLIKRVKLVQVNNADDLQLVRTKLKFSNVKALTQAFDIPDLQPNTDAHTDSKLKILFVGRLTEAKGIQLLISIAKLMHEKYPESFEMKIAGSGDAAFVNQVKELANNTPEVKYLGHVPNEEVSKLYMWTDITIITSEYETLNKVAIETAIAGKVAICTDIPGPREVIKDKVTGFLLPPDPKQFVENIAKLARMKKDSAKDLTNIGAKAYEYVKNKFNATKAYSDMYEDFKEVAQKG